MSRVPGNNCRFPVAMRWLHTGGNLARPDNIHHRTDRALMRSEHPPKCPLHPAELPYVQTRRSNPAKLTAIIELGAGIKSP